MTLDPTINDGVNSLIAMATELRKATLHVGAKPFQAPIFCLPGIDVADWRRLPHIYTPATPTQRSM